MDERAAGSNQGWRRAIRLIPIGLLLIGVASYLRDLRGFAPREERIPLAPLVVSPDLKTADSLPATPGALRGHDVVLVTLDTTRPDRLGCYGNSQSTTPNIDRLAREGVIFSAAVAAAPSTLPAHASILTGLYPLQHGLVDNGLKYAPKGTDILIAARPVPAERQVLIRVSDQEIGRAHV